jgi:hypothetical protein
MLEASVPRLCILVFVFLACYLLVEIVVSLFCVSSRLLVVHLRVKPMSFLEIFSMAICKFSLVLFLLFNGGVIQSLYFLGCPL